MEHYYRSCWSVDAYFWSHSYHNESLFDENALVSSKADFLIGLAVYHYWCWKKVLVVKNLNFSELSTPNIKLRQANEIATFYCF